MKRPAQKPSQRLHHLAAQQAERQLWRQHHPGLDQDKFAWVFKTSSVGMSTMDRATGRSPVRELLRKARQLQGQAG